MNTSITNKMICVLCASVKRGANGGWVSNGTEDRDFELGAPGGNLRLLAAYQLYKEDPKITIFLPGHRGHDVVGDSEDRPDLSDVLERELLELGVPGSNIITENKSNNTAGQLQALAEYSSEKDVEVIVITNEYHINRVKAMIENFPTLSDLNKSTVVVRSAEEILLASDRASWQKVLDSFYSNPKMSKIVKSEADGVSHIKQGIYGKHRN